MKRQKTPDSSPYVYQDEKFKGKLQFRNRLKWTEKQQKFIELASHKDTRIILIKGPAGTSKTLLAVYAGLLLIDQKRVSEMLYIRSAVESSDSKAGFLPGTLEEKMMYYNAPFYDKLDELIPSPDVDSLRKKGAISCFSTNYARGMSWNAKVMVLDEAQNSTRKEIVTIMTRLGKFSKLFMCADPLQADLNNGKGGGFEELYNLFNNQESRDRGIFVFEFSEEDIMRDELLKFVVHKIRQLPVRH